MPEPSHSLHTPPSNALLQHPAPEPIAPSSNGACYARMPLRPMSLGKKIRGALKYAWVRIRGGPMLVNMEVTHLCNARCDFCDFWKTKRSGKLHEYDYLDALRRFNPLCVTLTGGEPTLNKHLPEVVQRIKQSFGFIYVGMVTHASILTPAKAQAFWDAGIDQISISLNYLGAEHDAERGIDGLYEHVSTLIPQMTAQGMNVVLNTVIMRDNLDHIIPIARQAREWGAKISYSCYSDFKNGNGAHLVEEEHVARVAHLVEELIALKSELGNIVSSAYYLRRIPAYFDASLPRTCQAAGKWLVQLTPDGEIKPCPELAVTSHYTEYKRRTTPIECDRCWYSCRGETQASLTIERAAEVMGRV